MELIHFRVAYGDGSYELCLSRKVNRTPTLNLEHLLAEPRDHPSWACHVFAQLIFRVDVQWVPFFGELEGLLQDLFLHERLWVKRALLADSPVPLSLLSLASHQIVAIFHFPYVYLMDRDVGTPCETLLFSYTNIVVMMIVEGIRVNRSRNCRQVQVNPSLHSHCISFGEESFLVEPELFFGESIDKVRAYFGDVISHGHLMPLISRYSMSQKHHVHFFIRWWHRLLFFGHRGILRPWIPLGRGVRVMKRPLKVQKVLHLRMITVHLKSLHILQYFQSLLFVSRDTIIDAEINGPMYI